MQPSGTARLDQTQEKTCRGPSHSPPVLSFTKHPQTPLCTLRRRILIPDTGFEKS